MSHSNVFTPADVGFWIRYSDVNSSLLAVPASTVENLELDTKGIEMYKDSRPASMSPARRSESPSYIRFVSDLAVCARKF